MVLPELLKHCCLIFFIWLPLNNFSQKVATKPGENCSVIISRVSEEWKIDSLGKNGFRIEILEELLYSKIDKVTKNLLFEKRGGPVRISKFYSGNTNKNYVGFIYYVLNMNDYPINKPFSGQYIQFVFDENQTLLLYIEEGDYCG